MRRDDSKFGILNPLIIDGTALFDLGVKETTVLGRSNPGIEGPLEILA